MSTLAAIQIDVLWRYALVAVPVAIMIAGVCRLLPCRPSTRHTLWLGALLFMVVAPFLPQAPVPDTSGLLLDAQETLYRTASSASAKLATLAAPAERAAPTPADASSVAPPVAEDAPIQKNTRDHRARPAHTSEARTSGASPAPDVRPARTAGPARRVATPQPGRRKPASPRGEATIQPAVPGVEVRVAARHPGSAVPLTERVGDAHSNTDTDADADADTDANANANADANTDANANAHANADAHANTDAHTDADARRASWLAQLSAVRESVMSLPPIPPLIWGGGAALLLMLLALRIVRFLGLLRQATPAPAEIVRMVSDSAATLKLKRAPQTLVVDAQISPMVWCGRTPRLLVPKGLWAALDEQGRRAVIFHELAHLRRHDHWVVWLETIIGCIYWWHPVVWWIRRRLREEADLCCDAWVISLMPAARRQYAQALLQTKKFTSSRHAAIPAVQLGVSTSHAKRFARRLTMVMTQPLAPRLTFGGALLVCTLATASWLVAPALACPPDEKDKKRMKAAPAPHAPKAAKAPKAPKAPKAARAPRPGADPHPGPASRPATLRWTAPMAPAAPRPAERPARASGPAPRADARPAPQPDASTTFERYMNERGEDDLEDRVRELEQKLDRLHKRLEKLGDSAPGQASDRLPQMMERMRRTDAPDVAIDIPAEFTFEMSEPADMQFGGAAPPGGQIERAYELPPGRLEALTKIMVRDDVPVLVSPGKTSITVYGTAAQHSVFKAFVDILTASDETTKIAYELPAGKLQAMTDLMVRDDVPVFVSPGKTSITVHGRAAEQAIFNAFVKMIGTDGTTVSGTTTSPLATRYENAAARYVDAFDLQHTRALAARAAEMAAEAQYGRRDQAAALLQQARELEKTAKKLEKQARDIERQAEKEAKDAASETKKKKRDRKSGDR